MFGEIEDGNTLVSAGNVQRRNRERNAEHAEKGLTVATGRA